MTRLTPEQWEAVCARQGVDPATGRRLSTRQVPAAASERPAPTPEPRSEPEASSGCLRIRVPGEPVGKGRPRATRDGRMYTPEGTRRWERRAADAARAAAAAAGWMVERGEPLGMRVQAVKSRPQRLSRRADPDGRMVRPAKPDADNVAKAAADALQLAGVVVDDAQVVWLEARSWYAARDEEPCVEIEIWRVEG